MNMLKAVLILSGILLAPFVAHSASVGDDAPAFTLKDLKGNDVALESFKGRVVFLDFWASWCGPCKEEFPELEVLYKKFKDQGFEVVAVSVDKSASKVGEFLAKRPVSFTVLQDASGDVASSYKLVGMPVGFIIGRDGVVAFRQAGYSKAFIPVYEKKIVELLKKP